MKRKLSVIVVAVLSFTASSAGAYSYTEVCASDISGIFPEDILCVQKPVRLEQNFKGDHLFYVSGCSFEENGVGHLDSFLAGAAWNEDHTSETLIRISHGKCEFIDNNHSGSWFSRISKVYAAELDPGIRGLNRRTIRFDRFERTINADVIVSDDPDILYGDEECQTTNGEARGDRTVSARGVLAHEFGHAIGLGHPAPSRFALMQTVGVTSPKMSYCNEGWLQECRFDSDCGSNLCLQGACAGSTVDAGNGLLEYRMTPDDLGGKHSLYPRFAGASSFNLAISKHSIWGGTVRPRTSNNAPIVTQCGETIRPRRFSTHNRGTEAVSYERSVRIADLLPRAANIHATISHLGNRFKSPGDHGAGVFAASWTLPAVDASWFRLGVSASRPNWMLLEVSNVRNGSGPVNDPSFDNIAVDPNPIFLTGCP